jgi:hypothetical protein
MSRRYSTVYDLSQNDEEVRLFSKHSPTEIYDSFGNFKCIHARELKNRSSSIRDKDLTAVVRLGTNFVSNYYEIRTTDTYAIEALVV